MQNEEIVNWMVVVSIGITIIIYRSYTSIVHKLKQFKMGQLELSQDIQTLTAQVTKVFSEVSGLKDRIADLEDNLPEDVSPELQAAVDALKAQIQVVDDLVPDAPAPEV